MIEAKTVPRIESIKGVLKFVENPIPVINDALKTYGSTYYTRIVGGRKLIMTVDPMVTQHVLQKNNKNYEKSEIQTESLGKYVGLGLLTANGEYWKRQRKLIQPSFHKSKLASLTSIMENEIVKFYDELIPIAKEGKAIDINDTMMELTLRIVSKSLFSTGINEDLIAKLGKTFHELQLHIIREVRQPMFNWWRRMIGKEKKALQLAQNVRTIMQDIISKRRQGTAQKDDLLDLLLNSSYEDNGAYMTDEQVLNEAIILFVAGHETTANTLAWCLYALRQHPDIKERLVDSFDLDGPNTMDSLMKPSYSAQVLDETMRMYPAAWILDRVALEDDEVDGLEIKKGDLIGLFVYGTHRDEVLWNEPLTFDPDRFHPNHKKDRHKFAYYPFGGGPRMCIGYHFAGMEMRMALSEFFKRFDLPAPSEKNIESLPLITLKPEENIMMKLSVKEG